MAAKDVHIDFMFLVPSPPPGRWMRYWEGVSVRREEFSGVLIVLSSQEDKSLLEWRSSHSGG